MEEVAGILLQHLIDRGIAMARRPLGAPARLVDVALGLFRRAVPS
jgi:hypothetical protein